MNEWAYLCYRPRLEVPVENGIPVNRKTICRTGPFSFEVAFKYMLQFLPLTDEEPKEPVYVETEIG